MNNIKRINRMNEQELLRGYSEAASWHEDYRNSSYIHVSGFPFDLTEGDILAVFSQYGTIIDLNLIRDRDTGKSKGFAFIGYTDQRSTDLAVDNFNGIQLLNRTLKVDHCANYKQPKHLTDQPRKSVQEKLASEPPAEPPKYRPMPPELQKLKDETAAKINALNPEDPFYESTRDKLIENLKNEAKRFI